MAVVDLKIKIIKYTEEFRNKYYRDPTEQEISEELSVPLKKVTSILGLDFQSRSLNEKISTKKDKEGAELQDIVQNATSFNPHEIFLEKDDENLLNKFIRAIIN